MSDDLPRRHPLVTPSGMTQPGEWPTEPTRTFQPDGAVAIHEQPPASGQVPSYPSPTGG